jgi:hypothetical protein
MQISFDGRAILGLRVGARVIVRAYLGDRLVWAING